MVATLGNWATQCEEVLGDLEGRMEGIKKAAVERRKEKEEYEKEVAGKLEGVKTKKDSAGGGGAGPAGAAGGAGSQVTGKGKRVISEGEEALGGYEDLMDLDEDGSGTGLLGLGGGGRKRKGAKVAANKRR